MTRGTNHHSKVTAIIDTREQCPLDLKSHGLEVVTKKLDFGDYSLKFPNLERVVSIERKSLPDFIACCGKERKRFQKELLALRGFRYKALVLEFELQDVLDKRYKSMIEVNSVMSSISRWMSMDIPFIFTGSHGASSHIVASMLKLIAKDVLDFAKDVVK